MRDSLKSVEITKANVDKFDVHFQLDDHFQRVVAIIRNNEMDEALKVEMKNARENHFYVELFTDSTGDGEKFDTEKHLTFLHNLENNAKYSVEMVILLSDDNFIDKLGRKVKDEINELRVRFLDEVSPLLIMAGREPDRIKKDRFIPLCQVVGDRLQREVTELEKDLAQYVPTSEKYLKKKAEIDELRQKYEILKS